MPTTGELLRDQAADRAFSDRVAQMRVGAVTPTTVKVDQIAGAAAVAGAPTDGMTTSSVVIDAETGDVYHRENE